MSKIQNIKVLKWSEKNIDYTAIAGDNILVTAMGITITLPVSPVIGDTVQVANGIAYTTSYYTTFNIASTKMFSVEARKTFYFKNYQYMTFVYQDSTVGWVYYYNTYNYFNITDVCGADNHVLVINKNDGSVWAWGYNPYGQLGNNSVTSRSSPVSVVGGISFIKISGGGHQSAGIRGVDGTGWAWGYNNCGQLGNSSLTNYSSPRSVLGGISFTKISVGSSHMIGIRGSDGTAWAWGLNSFGQVGDNSRTSRSSPVSVVGGISFTYILAGNTHSAGIRGSDGTAWSWGDNTNGKLGTNNATSYSSPSSVVGGISYSKLVYYGCLTSMGIRGSDGTGWSWGYNTYGNLGDGSRTDRSSPVSILGGISWKQISGGEHMVIGIRGSDGTGWSWGSNSYGGLGTGNVTSYSSPASVVGNFSFSQINIGYNHSVGIRCDNVVWSWGKNSYGNLGTGNMTSYSSPVSVLSLGIQ